MRNVKSAVKSFAACGNRFAGRLFRSCANLPGVDVDSRIFSIRSEELIENVKSVGIERASPTRQERRDFSAKCFHWHPLDRAKIQRGLSSDLRQTAVPFLMRHAHRVHAIGLVELARDREECRLLQRHEIRDQREPAGALLRIVRQRDRDRPITFRRRYPELRIDR